MMKRYIEIKKMFALFISFISFFYLSGAFATEAEPQTDYSYFKFSNAFHSSESDARRRIVIYTRASRDDPKTASDASTASYSGACTFSYGGTNRPALNEHLANENLQTASTTFPQYLTKYQRDKLMNTDLFFIGAYAEYPIRGTYSATPSYSTVPHFCEKTPVAFERNGRMIPRNRTGLGDLTKNSQAYGSYLRLRSLNGLEDLFQFKFLNNRIVMEAKTKDWWKDTLAWPSYFYPNFKVLGDLHGPAASLYYKDSNASARTPIGKFNHLYLNYSFKNNLQNSEFQDKPYGVNTASYRYPTNLVPRTATKTYNSNTMGGGVRFGISFRFDDNGTFCTETATKTKSYGFNLIENVFDERFEFIDHWTTTGTLNVHFAATATDGATGIMMFRYPLQNLLPSGSYVRGGKLFNPFKTKGLKTSITNFDLLPIIRSDVIPELVGAVVPAKPSCIPVKSDQDYYDYILNKMYVPNAGTGVETGGIVDLSFDLFEFSLEGTDTPR